MALIGGVIIFAGSYFFTSVVFPNYFSEMRTLGEEILKAQGKADAEIKSVLDAQAVTQTSFMQALMGFIGTLVTGFIVSLIVGAIWRKKEAAPASTPQS
jgi:uncharacterized membrane protein